MVFVGLALLALWEWSRLDLPLIRLYGSVAGFPLRDHWLTAKILHDGTRLVGWVFFALLLMSIWRPKLLAAGLPRRDRIWWIVTTLICVALIPLLKRASSTSCPWSLIQFGGEVAHYVPHWVLGLQDGGPGDVSPRGMPQRPSLCCLAGLPCGTSCPGRAVSTFPSSWSAERASHGSR